MGKKNNETFWDLAQKISNICTEVSDSMDMLRDKRGISPKKAAKKEEELAEYSKKLKDAIVAEFKKNGHDSAKDISFATALALLIEYTRFCASALATMSESPEDENKPTISFNFCLPDPIEEKIRETNHVVGPVDAVEMNNSDDPKEDLIFPGYEFAFRNPEDSKVWKGYDRFNDFISALCTDAGLSKFKSVFKDPEKLKKEKKKAKKKKKEKKAEAKLPKIAKSAKFVKELQEIANIFISDATEEEQNQQIEDVILDLVKRELKDCDNPARTAIGILNNVCYNSIPIDEREGGTRLRRVCYGSRAIHDVVVRAIGDGLDASGDVNRYFEIAFTQAYVCNLRDILFDHKPESLDMNHLGFSLVSWLVTRPEINSKLEAYEAAWKLFCDHIGHKFYVLWPFAKYEIGIYNSFEAGPFLKEMIKLKIEDKITPTHKDWVSLSLWLQEKVYGLEPNSGGKSYEPLKSDTFPCSLYACADIILKEVQGHVIPHANGVDTWLYQHAFNRLELISKFPGLSCEGHYHFSAHAHYVLRALEEYFLEGADKESFRISKHVMEEPLSDDMMRKLSSSNMSGKTILTISAKCGWEWTGELFSGLDHEDVLNAYLWAVMLYQDSINEGDFIIIEFARELLNNQLLFKKILKHLLRSSVMDWGDLSLQDMFDNILHHLQKYSEEDVRLLLEKVFREAASDFLKAPGHIAYYLKDNWAEKEEKLQQFLTMSEKVADEEEINFPEILGKSFGESLGTIVPDKETINALSTGDGVFTEKSEGPLSHGLPKPLPFLNHWRGRFQEIVNLIDSGKSKKKQDKEIEEILVNFFEFELKNGKIKIQPAKKALKLLAQFRKIFYLVGEKYLKRVERVLYSSYKAHHVITSEIELQTGRNADSYTYHYYTTVISRFVDHRNKKDYVFDIPSKRISMETIAVDLLRLYVKKREYKSKLEAMIGVWETISGSFNPNSAGWMTWMFVDEGGSLKAGQFLSSIISEYLKTVLNVTDGADPVDCVKNWKLASEYLYSTLWDYQHPHHHNPYLMEVNPTDEYYTIFTCANIIDHEFVKNAIIFTRRNGSDDWLFSLAINRIRVFKPEDDKRKLYPYAGYILKAFEDYYMKTETSPEDFRISKNLIEGYAKTSTLHNIYSINPCVWTIVILSASKGWVWTGQWMDVTDSDVQNAYLIACLLNPKFCGKDYDTKKAIHDRLARSMVEVEMKLSLRYAILSILTMEEEIDWSTAMNHFIDEFSSNYSRDTVGEVFISTLKEIIKQPGNMGNILSEKWDTVVEKFTALIKSFESRAGISERIASAFYFRWEVPEEHEGDIKLLSKLLEENPEQFVNAYRDALSHIYTNTFYNTTDETRKDISPLGIYEAYNDFIITNLPEFNNVFGDRILKDCYFEILNAFSCLDTGDGEGREDLCSFIAWELAEDFNEPDHRLDHLRVAFHRASIHLEAEEVNQIAIDVFEKTRDKSLAYPAPAIVRDQTIDRFYDMIDAISTPGWYMWGLSEHKETSFLFYLLKDTIENRWLVYFPVMDIYKHGVEYLTRLSIVHEDGSCKYLIRPKTAIEMISKILDFRMYELGKEFPGIFDFMVPLFEECMITLGATDLGSGAGVPIFTDFIYEMIQSMISDPKLQFFTPEALYSLPDVIKVGVYLKGVHEIDPGNNIHPTVKRFRCDLVNYFGYSYLGSVDERFLENGSFLRHDIVYLALSGKSIDSATKNEKEFKLIQNTLQSLKTIAELSSIIKEAMFGALLAERGIYNMDLGELYKNLKSFLNKFEVHLGTGGVTLEREGRRYMATSYKQLFNHMFKEMHKKDFSEETENLLTEAGLKALNMYKEFKKSIQ